ncbi:hypothetical protein IKE98_03725 [Candidatus Saccharibacteria bacterium]|nr:hypothetical protein [Candidatus Saccharibacteria bacterium]
MENRTKSLLNGREIGSESKRGRVERGRKRDDLYLLYKNEMVASEIEEIDEIEDAVEETEEIEDDIDEINEIEDVEYVEDAEGKQSCRKNLARILFVFAIMMACLTAFKILDKQSSGGSVPSTPPITRAKFVETLGKLYGSDVVEEVTSQVAAESEDKSESEDLSRKFATESMKKLSKKIAEAKAKGLIR